MINKKDKFTSFSVGLGLLDYINPILYTITTIIIINNMSKIMIVPWNIFYMIGALISIVGGLCIPTIKVLIGLNKIKFKLPVMFVFIVNTGIFISGLALFKSILNLNHYLINKGKGIIVIPVEKVDKYKSLLIRYYESNNDHEIKDFIRKECYIEI